MIAMMQNIKELKGIYESENKIIIGALTTHNEVAHSSIIKKNIKGLSYLASKIADNAVRNSGTIGGSICNADPAADYPAALLSLDATVFTNSRQILGKDFLSVNKNDQVNWEEIKHIVISFINDFYSDGKEFVIGESLEEQNSNLNEIEKKIVKFWIKKSDPQ